jgi:hypothetical protein
MSARRLRLYHKDAREVLRRGEDVGAGDFGGGSGRRSPFRVAAAGAEADGLARQDMWLAALVKR